MLHKHRILPGHMGGTYSPENISILTIPEHAEAHHQLFLRHGFQADFVAWKMLSGQMGKEEAFLIIVRSPERSAKISMGMKGKRNSLGHKHTPMACSKISQGLLGNKNGIGNTNSLGRRASPEQRKQMSISRLGNQRAKGYRWTAEQRAKMMGNRNAIGCKRPDLAERNRQRHQREIQ